VWSKPLMMKPLMMKLLMMKLLMMKLLMMIPSWMIQPMAMIQPMPGPAFLRCRLQSRRSYLPPGHRDITS
jgi:hypothetical protein